MASHVDTGILKRVGFAGITRGTSAIRNDPDGNLGVKMANISKRSAVDANFSTVAFEGERAVILQDEINLFLVHPGLPSTLHKFGICLLQLRPKKTVKVFPSVYIVQQ